MIDFLTRQPIFFAAIFFLFLNLYLTKLDVKMLAINLIRIIYLSLYI